MLLKMMFSVLINDMVTAILSVLILLCRLSMVPIMLIAILIAELTGNTEEVVKSISEKLGEV